MCPYLETSHPNCSTHLNLRNLVQVFAHCAGRYEKCPVYRELQSHVCAYDVTRHTAIYTLLAAS